ncbi:YSIRK-type signal peptide-containing protein [Dolosigranulum pigrum]|uniref:YSIRK-type signal peptide-containing protein n=1 Tax=Dolosigranulum pigrum TaxID=29394 RepID=UPI001918FE9F|nr:YSIRK-type signal peptide-containing protein [Dolosigranulum pigrum]
MIGKNNKHVQLRQEADKQTRFSLKKLTVGVASIAVGATLLLGQPISVNAEEQSTTTQTDQSLGEYKEAAKKDLADKKIENEHLNSLIDSAESKEAVDKLVANYTQPEIATEDTDNIKDLKLYKAAKIAALKAKDIDNETALKTIEDAETKEAVDKLFKGLDAKVEKPADETTAPTETEESAPTQAAESTETEATEATEEPKVADQATESIPDEVTSETEEDDDYAEAVRELNDLNLSDTIKEDFAQKIKEAEDNKEAVSQILTEAIDLAELNIKKDAALVEIDQTNLHVDDSNELKGRIEVATSAEEVDNVLTDAGKRAEEQAIQAQNGEATTEEKPEAQTKPAPEKKPEEAPKPEEKKPETDKNPAPEKKPEAGQKPEAEKKPDKNPEAKKPENKKTEEKKPENKKPEAKKPEEKKPEEKKPEVKKPEEKKPEAKKPEQKPDQQKQPDKSADKAAQDKKEQELKMAAAKDEAKKEINNLANLSDKQKGELLAGIDKADTPAKIGEILDFARKLNQDQAPKQQKKQGERLPDTATGAWALGLIGATAILAGFGIKKFKK